VAASFSGSVVPLGILQTVCLEAETQAQDPTTIASYAGFHVGVGLEEPSRAPLDNWLNNY